MIFKLRQANFRTVISEMKQLYNVPNDTKIIIMTVINRESEKRDKPKLFVLRISMILNSKCSLKPSIDSSFDHKLLLLC